MAEGDGKRSGRGSRPGHGDFDGRDLLVGRREPATASRESDASGTGAETLAHILATLRPMKARLDVLQAGPGPSDEATVALERAKAQLSRTIQDARGALAAAAVPDAKRKQEEAVSARLLTDGARALEDQAAEIEKHLEKALEQERAVAVSFVADAVAQRETGLATLGDPRHAWNVHVVRHYAPLLASCAGKAVVDDRSVNCRIVVTAPRAVTVPVYPGGVLEPAPREEEFDPARAR